MIPPGPGFVGLLRERARRSPARGFQRFGPPLGAAPKPAAPLGVSHGEAGKSTTLPGLLRGEAGKPTALPGLLHGEARKPTTVVAFARTGLFRPRGRPERRASLYRAEKPVFTKRRRLGDGKSFFVRRFVACFFARPERNWRCRRGKSPPPRNPGRPAAAPPNDRDRLPVFAPPARTPAPATPPQSACSRRLSGCPQRPNLSARRRAESPKGKRKGGTPDETRTAALTTAPPEDGWEGSQPKRPQRRGKPAKQPRRSAQ